MLDLNNETFVVYVTIRKQDKMPVYSEKRVQIQNKAQIRALLFDEAPTEVPVEYSDYSKIFSTENAAKLLENTGMNKYAIKLEESKQPSFGLIYSLGPIEFEMLKTYIKINLANGFIWLSKSLACIPILFNQKPDKNLYLYVDYWDLNNITIKNQYPLLLIGKSLDQHGQAKCFS